MLDPHPSGPDLRQQSVLMKKNNNRTRLISNVAGTVLRSVNNHGLTGDGVCDRHEGGVQSGGHAPHGVVSHNPSEAKGGDHLSERRVGRDESQSQTGGNTCGDRAGDSIQQRDGWAHSVRRNGTIPSSKHACIFYKRLRKRSDS